MARYIDAEKLIADGWRLERQAPSGKILTVMSIADVSTADVVEVRHGKWLVTDSFDHHYTPIYRCSVCLREVADNYIELHKHCLHCGAKMDGERK